MPRRLNYNEKTQEILLLLSRGLNYNEAATASGVSRAWVYTIARREMERFDTKNCTELLTLFCEHEITRAQEMRITAERLIQMAEELETRNRLLLDRVSETKEKPEPPELAEMRMV